MMEGLLRRYRLLCLFAVGLSLSGSLFSQTPFDSAFRETAFGILEHLELFTDRSIYITGEEIFFRADYTVEKVGQEHSWSSLLYMELLDPSGRTVAEGKYSISNGIATGSLNVPGGGLTGIYHLKAYTRWMRNRGPDSFSYFPLNIINPMVEEVASNGGETGGEMEYPRRVFQMEGLICSIPVEEYEGGEEIRFSVGIQPDYPQEMMRCCVTVVPSGSVDPFSGQYLDHELSDDAGDYEVNFLPDLGPGVTLSGSVIDADQLPVPHARLYFSVLSGDRDFYVATSDENGRFILSLRSGTGDQELFVTPGRREEGVPVVRIDQDFDIRQTILPPTEFRLTAEQAEAARKLAIKTQLKDEFTPDTTDNRNDSVQVDAGANAPPFYGTSVDRLLIDDYVMLPNLEEVFINLVPNVHFYKRRGRTLIRIYSSNNFIDIYEPLVMIDDIPVFDLEALQALSAEKIERIDLINDPYLKGSSVIGGVLAIHSRNGDMAGIDLPEGGYFFDLQSAHSPVFRIEPAYPDEKRVPDTRNTLLWLSDLLLEKGNSTNLTIKAPDLPGEYIVLVRGVASDGEVVAAQSSFRVK